MPAPPPVALVTGGARRLGAAIVRRLHAAGFAVVVHCRDSAADAQALAAELEAARAGSAAVLQADLERFDALPELVARTVGRFGRLDALVNNAAAFFPTPAGTVTPAQWDTLLATNLRAPFFLCQAAAPHLARTGGAIVNVVDIYAERPLRGHAVYSMAKAALAMATRSLALELGPDVRVNGVAPGNVLWSENPVKAETLETVLERTALERQGEPGDIAEAVLWLLQGNRYVTGQILAVDGGRTLTI